MTLKEYYLKEKAKPTPAQNFIAEIARITMRSENTVRMWVNGLQVPDTLAQSIISAKLGVDASQLFPQKTIKVLRKG